MKPSPGVRFRPAADLIHLAESEVVGGGVSGRCVGNKMNSEQQSVLVI